MCIDFFKQKEISKERKENNCIGICVSFSIIVLPKLLGIYMDICMIILVLKKDG